MTPNPNPSLELRETIARIVQREEFRPTCLNAALDDICALPAKPEHYAAADRILALPIEALPAPQDRNIATAKRLAGMMGCEFVTPPTPAETVTVALPGAGEEKIGNSGLLDADISARAKAHVAAMAIVTADPIAALKSLVTVAAANDEGVAK